MNVKRCLLAASIVVAVEVTYYVVKNWHVYQWVRWCESGTLPHEPSWGDFQAEIDAQS